MPNQHLVRVGLLGQIGRFSSPSGSLFPRGRRVICRTIRGLEVGMVLQTPATADLEPEEPIEELATQTIVEERSSAPDDGTVLRLVTPEDDLLLARLERNRQDAYVECVKLLSERCVSATLVDVEHLFDGSSLYFYFLGEVTPEVDQLTSELASVYEAKVEFRRFAETLQQGCGPDCGTESASGCGTSCSSCVLVGACTTRES